MSERCALIVEDSLTMRQLISFALRRIPGLAFLEAENGAEALELLKEHPVDLILLDINMPVMSGPVFLQRLDEAELEKKPPVVIITTEGGEADIRQAKAYGVKAYVTKPVQAATLAATVQDVLDRFC